jgi:ubiquinone biosynthesis protein
LIEQELEKPIGEVFASFDEQPVASASIGQVHRAVLYDGRSVAVKVQHVGIEDKIRDDLEIAMELVKLVESHSTEAALYRPVNTVAEVRRSLLNELDFSQELRNTRSFAHHFHKDPSVCFADVFPEFSTRRVLTMEFLEGTSLS